MGFDEAVDEGMKADTQHRHYADGVVLPFRIPLADEGGSGIG